MRILLSDRREDASGHAGCLRPRIQEPIRPRDHVFIDVDAIPLGSTFPLTRSPVRSRPLRRPDRAHRSRLAPRAPDPEGGRRLDDAGDYVRLEIETALASAVVVVPVSVQGARIPKPRELPETLAPMTPTQRLRSSGCFLAGRCREPRPTAGGLAKTPTDQWAANERWSLPSAARSGFDLIRRLHRSAGAARRDPGSRR